MLGKPYTVIRLALPLVNAIGKRVTDFGIRILAICLLTAVLSDSLTTHAAPAPQTAVPVVVYWQHISDLQALVGELEGLPAAEQHLQLDAAAADLARITAVTLPDGQTLPLDHSFLLRELRAEPLDLDRLAGLLAALDAGRASWPQAQFSAAAALPLAEILSRPEFQYQEELNPLEKWLQEMQQRFWQWLARIAPQSDLPIASLLGRAVPILAIVVLLLVLLYAARGLFGDFAADAELRSHDSETAALTSAAALAQAQRFSESGDQRTAVRYLYLASLLHMEEHGLLRYDRSRTNQEYLRLVRSQPELAATLRDVVAIFDRVWYGYQPIDETTFEQYRRRVAALQHIHPSKS
ncbi:MAG: DUF4129 domain-containing protein [Chloroflexota bacterium]